MSLIRRKTLPKLVKTSEIARRWQKSSERVRQILKAAGARKVQFAGDGTSPFYWVAADVERVEEKILKPII